MLYSRRNSLEDQLVQALLQNASTIKELHAEVSPRIGPVSMRAVYKAADALIDAGVVVKVGKRLWINQQWVRSLRERLAPSVPPLGKGERVTYTFTSLQHLDVFWKTIAFQFEEYERDGEIFFYNPHNFWAYIPELKESEDDYYAHFAKSKKRAYFTVGGTSEADREFKRTYQDNFLQVDAREIPSLGRRDHITILGDYIITAKLSSVLVQKLDGLYASGSSIESILPDILKAYHSNASVKLMVEHNAAKAKKLRSLLSRNFVLA